MTATGVTRVVLILAAVLALAVGGSAQAGELPAPVMSVTANPTAVEMGKTVEVTLSLSPGEELMGSPAEWWVVVKDPNGKKYYLSGNLWHEQAMAYSLADLANFSRTFTSPPLTIAGTWTCYFALDGDKDGQLADDAYSASASATVGGATQAPTPTILAAPASADRDGTSVLTISMDSGSFEGNETEWWLVANSPGGARYYYNGSTWTTTKSYYSRAALHDISGTAITTPTLNWIGLWHFYFGIDGLQNNEIDEAYYDSTTVTVTGGTQASWSIDASNANLNPGDSAELDLNLFSGSYTGVPAEVWLVGITPAGDKLYFNGSEWTQTGAQPMSSGALADVDRLVASFPLTLDGTYSFYFGADDDLNGAIDKPAWLDVARVHVAQGPQASIKANGTSGSLTVAAGTTVELSIALQAGSYNGLNADWWLVGINQAGVSFTYNADSKTWTNGYHTYRQTPLADIDWTPATSVTLTDKGVYHFYFGVDDPNGYVDVPVYQEVVVYVE